MHIRQTLARVVLQTAGRIAKWLDPEHVTMTITKEGDAS